MNSRRYELVATLGPSSFDLATDIARAGATRFRLNASHMSPERLVDMLDRLRGDSVTASVPVVVDLQGAKMRFDEESDTTVTDGEEVTISLRRSGSGGLVAPHPELFDAARSGDVLRVDDDRVRFRVLDVMDRERIRVRAMGSGRVHPRKGVNLLEHPVALEGLTSRDSDHVRLAAQYEHVSFAVSFMATGTEAGWVRQLAPSCEVVAKIERRAATENVLQIAAATDRVWVCRGDLGSQLGVVQMARWVHQFQPSSVNKPVLMAGQVFACLERREYPSRSEVSHLADLVARGYVGVVLSDETAVGEHPINATLVVANLLDQMVAG